MRQVFLLVPVLSLSLAACNQISVQADSSPAGYASRPELQDADSQAILAQYGSDAELVVALQEAYGERTAHLAWPRVPEVSDLDLSSDRLNYIKRTGWGSVANYNAQFAAYAGTNRPYPGLDWSRDGCSAPDGLGLGYREDFRPACNVHDFAYRNLGMYQRTETNRKTSDDAFYTNMKAICAAKSWYKRPACYSAAYAYYQAVRLRGGSKF